MDKLNTELKWEIESLNEDLAACRAGVIRRAGEIVEVGKRDGADRKYLIDEMAGIAAALQREMTRMAEIAARRDALANVQQKLNKLEA